MFVFFFFKQKTAYEMRISDWSSDVCSSDLLWFIHDWLAQHLAHKTILSITAWLIFGTLLWGRVRPGWRGRVAIRWAPAGYAMLLLAYFGSKLFQEAILGRHWPQLAYFNLRR